jgi:hypothetical protein
MKKIFLVLSLGIIIATALTSCGASRKTGCPMTEKIIH